MANNTDEELEAKKARIQKERLKVYFRDVITKQDFNYEEYAAKAAEWKELTGEEFDYDILLVADKQDVLVADEEILENIEAIDSIYAEDETKEHFENIVKKTQKRVEIVDDDGTKLDAEKSHDLLSSLMLVSMEEVVAMNADNKKFAQLETTEKRKALWDDVDVSFNLKAATAAAASAIDLEADEETNARKSQAAVEDYMSGKKVTVKKDHIINAVSSSVSWIKEKINKFKQKGFKKTVSKLTSKIGNFVKWFSKKNLGALKDSLVKDVKENPAQWLTNAGVAVASFGATFASAPIALGAVATYAAYTAISTPLWNLNRKRNQEKKAALQNNADVSVWRGWTGLKNAWKKIKDNPEEKKVFNRQWGIATGVGVASAAVIGVLAPSVMATANATQLGNGFTAAASTNALSLTRAGTGALRVLGVNANATYNYMDARKKYQKTQSAEDKARMEAAGTGLALTALLTGAMETVAVSGVLANTSAHPEVPNVDQPVTEGLTIGHSEAANGSNMGFDWNSQDNNNGWAPSYQVESDVANGGSDVVGAGVDAAASNPDVPTAYDPSMGITKAEWGYIHTQVTPMYVGNFEDTYMNTVNAIQAHPDAFINPDGSAMTPEQVMWESSRIMALAKARLDANGGLIARFYDAQHQEVFPKMTDKGWQFFDGKGNALPDGVKPLPECYGDAETVKAFHAIYKMINCGEDVKDLNVARVKQFFDETMANGQYKGKGWNVGVTHNYMDRDGCGDIHWVRGKAVSKPSHTPTYTPSPTPPTETVVEQPPVTGPEIDTVEIVKQPEPPTVTGPSIGTLESEAKVNVFNGSSLEGDNANFYGGARSGNVQQGTLNGSKVTYPLGKGGGRGIGD